MKMNDIFPKRLTFGICTLAALMVASPAEASLFKKKKKVEKTETVSPYKKLTGRDSVAWNGVMNVISKDDTFYFEIPTRLLGRSFLVTNRLLKVPQELNESGVNKGINYENQVVSFHWNKKRKIVEIRQQRNTPEVNEWERLASSVSDNYVNPILCSLEVEAAPKDSSSVVVKVNDLFNGKNSCLNDVFNAINIGTSPKSDLSHVIGIKAFQNNVTARAELTTTVTEGHDKVNVTVEVSTSLTLLPETAMAGREENQRIGYFTTSRLQYTDTQQRVKTKRYVTRWRVEPKDTAAYLRGELTEPQKPILIYIDKAVPTHLRPYIKKGILDWNVAFERAGFKDVIRVEDLPDSLEREGDDIATSVLTYAASEKSNAMGPSTFDPRTGEIFEADIIWWHNVQALISDWVTVQTGPVNPAARRLDLPEELIGDAARFVACHEMGHSLGLRHNFIASAAYPTDSLRSRTFTDKMGGTAPSIMDYARFNYVAQPGDNVKNLSPNIGPYDLLAIEWGYRWFPDENQAKTALYKLLQAHQGPLYRYSEGQPPRTAIDPRTLSEDIGDDAMKSATYGIANLKRIVPNIVDWTPPAKEPWIALPKRICYAIHPTKNDKFLECYAGTGYIAESLSSSFAEAYAVDKRNISRKTPNVKFIRAEIDKDFFPKFFNGKGKDGKWTIYLDPPDGKALPANVISEIVASCPERILLNSSNLSVATMEIKRFRREGFMLRKIIPLDLEPGNATFQTLFLFVPDRAGLLGRHETHTGKVIKHRENSPFRESSAKETVHFTQKRRP